MKKKYLHPNPVFSDLAVLGEGTLIKLSGVEWRVLENPINLPSSGRRTVTKDGCKKQLHRFAYECYIGKELDYRNDWVVPRNYYRNDISIDNLTIPHHWPDYRKSAINGWSTKDPLTGRWTLNMGVGFVPEESITGFSSESNSRKHFFNLVRERGPVWLFRQDNLSEAASSGEEEVDPFDTPVVNRRAKYCIGSRLAASKLDINYKTFMARLLNGKGPRFVKYHNRRMFSQEDIDEYRNSSAEEKEREKSDLERPLTVMGESIQRLERLPFIQARPMTEETFEALQHQMSQFEILLEKQSASLSRLVANDAGKSIEIEELNKELSLVRAQLEYYRRKRL